MSSTYATCIASNGACNTCMNSVDDATLNSNGGLYVQGANELIRDNASAKNNLLAQSTDTITNNADTNLKAKKTFCNCDHFLKTATDASGTNYINCGFDASDTVDNSTKCFNLYQSLIKGINSTNSEATNNPWIFVDSYLAEFHCGSGARDIKDLKNQARILLCKLHQANNANKRPAASSTGSGGIGSPTCPTTPAAKVAQIILNIVLSLFILWIFVRAALVASNNIGRFTKSSYLIYIGIAVWYLSLYFFSSGFTALFYGKSGVDAIKPAPTLFIILILISKFYDEFRGVGGWGVPLSNLLAKAFDGPERYLRFDKLFIR